MRYVIPAVTAVAAALLSGAPAAAQDAAPFYEENCADCHTIGQGAQGGGPDLKGVTSRRDRGWLIRFLIDPEDFEHDPEVVRMIKEADGMAMPEIEGMNRRMAEALLTLIDQRSAAAAGTPVPAAPPPPVAFTEEHVARGRALFTGASRLSAAGSACVGCHQAPAATTGGRLGPNLTAVEARLGGRKGLTAWLGSTPTPCMRALYRGTPLTADESQALIAFLELPAGPTAPRLNTTTLLLTLGLAGFLSVLLAAGLIWRRRFRAVRRPLVARASEEPRASPRLAPGRSASPAADAHGIGSGGPT